MAESVDKILGYTSTSGAEAGIEVGTGLALSTDNVLSGDADSPGAVNEENIELGQIRLTTSAATTVLQADATEAWLIRQMIITNTAGSTNVVSLYHDVDGTTYDDTTALIKGYSMPAGGVLNIDNIIVPLENSTGALGLSTSKSDVNFTAWGIKLAEANNTYKQLAQADSPTTAASLYTLPSGKKTVITGIFAANLGSSSRAQSIFWDEDGTTYDKTTAVHWELPIAGDEFVIFAEKKWLLETTGGSLGHEGSVASAINTTLYGQEEDV